MVVHTVGAEAHAEMLVEKMLRHLAAISKTSLVNIFYVGVGNSQVAYALGCHANRVEGNTFRLCV